MDEYGNMVQTFTGAPEVDDLLFKEMRRILSFNYEATRAAHPEWNLPDDWALVIGPVTRQWDYEDCSICHGDGQWSVYGEEGEYEGEHVCQPCDGKGMIAVRLSDPPRWVHSFGWHVVVN